jgi:hypothetical protein
MSSKELRDITQQWFGCLHETLFQGLPTVEQIDERLGLLEVLEGRVGKLHDRSESEVLFDAARSH